MIGTIENRTSNVLALASILVVLMAIMLFTADPAHAKTFTVNSTGDAGDNNPGNGSCFTGVSIQFGSRFEQECTLRAAIQEANVNGEFDTILFASRLSGAITLSGGQLEIADDTPAGDDDLLIEGPGAEKITVGGNDASRVFLVNEFANATIGGLTISDGFTDPGSPDPAGAGIRNTGTLTLTNAIVRNNTAAVGGGISNEGILTLTDSTVSGNSTTGGGGGGIVNANGGTLRLTDSTVSDNSTGGGGVGFGGGINNHGALELTDSTVSGNTAAGVGVGGGIRHDSGGTLTLTNSTVSGNTAAGDGEGGGIYIYVPNFATNGATTLTNTTVSHNSADYVGGIYIHRQSVQFDHPTTLSNTIVARNSADPAPDAGGGFISRGHNLIGEDGGSGGWIASDLTDVDPLLGRLQNNGGPTKTHALQPGSPAVDAGANIGCPDADQRGVARPQPQGARCDIGAFELSNSPPVARNDTYGGVEDRVLRVPARGVLRNDADPDGDALTARIVSRPKKGTLSLGSNGAFAYKPRKNSNGRDSFVYEAIDGRGGFDRATVSISVRPATG